MSNPFIRRRIISAGFRAAGAPPQVGEAASFAAYGATGAAFGVGIGALEGLRELIKLNGEAQESARKLSLAEHDTGVSFQTASGYADTFTSKLGSTRDATRELAGALADIQLRTGNLFQGEDVAGKLSTIIQARALDAEQAAKLLQGLGRGDSQAFEQLTGRSAALVLDNYAKSINTTASSLTDMERSQALVNAAIQRSGDFAAIAAERYESSAAKLERFKNIAHDFAQDFAASLIDTYTDPSKFIYGAITALNPAGLLASYAGLIKPPQADDALKQFAGINSPEELAKRTRPQPTTANTAQQEQAALQQQQQSARQLQEAFEKFGGERQTLLPAEQVERVRELQKLFESLKGSLSTDDLANYQKQLGSLTNDFTVQTRQARESLLSFLGDASSRLHTDNPFTQLFTEAATSANKLQEQFGVLGDDVVRQLAKIQNAAIEQEKFAARIQSNLQAVRLEFQADQLERGYVGITAEQTRQLGILQQQLEAAKSITGLRREADAYSRGFVSQNQFQTRREDFENFERIRRLRPQGNDEGARAGQKLIDDYILEQTKNLPIGARNSPDPTTRSLAADRASALNASADRLLANIQDEMKRAEAGRAGVELATKELQELGRLSQGGDRDTVRKEFLEITKALDPKELTGSLRKGMIEALREEAQHQRSLEQDAKHFQDELISPSGILYQIKEAIQNQGGMSAKTAAADATGNTAKPSTDTASAMSTGAQNFYKTFSQLAANNNPATPNPDEMLNTLAKAQAEGRYHGDLASLFTSKTASVGVPVQVNPYSQEFFRARPGYTAANDPKAYDPNNPYQEAFGNAGYLGSLKSSVAPALSVEDIRTLARSEFTGGTVADAIRETREQSQQRPIDNVGDGSPQALDVLNSIAQQLRVLTIQLAAWETKHLDRPAANVNLNIGDGLTANTNLLGSTPKAQPVNHSADIHYD